MFITTYILIPLLCVFISVNGASLYKVFQAKIGELALMPLHLSNKIIKYIGI